MGWGGGVGYSCTCVSAWAGGSVQLVAVCSVPMPRLCSRRLAVTRLKCGVRPGVGLVLGRGRNACSLQLVNCLRVCAFAQRREGRAVHSLSVLGRRKRPAHRGARSDGVASTTARGKG